MPSARCAPSKRRSHVKAKCRCVRQSDLIGRGRLERDPAAHALARSELRQRLRTPDVVAADRQRKRLLTRLEQLKKQHGWGDITDAEYRTERDQVRAALDQLPDGDRVIAFDAHRARILALPEAIAVASPARREELCRIVVERVVVGDRQVAQIEWVPAARPFFERQRACPQGDSNP